MKNNIYDLMKFMKDGCPPKRIEFNSIIWDYDEAEENYITHTKSNHLLLFGEYIYSIIPLFDVLYREVEILPEENDEWEDIEDITLNGETVGYGILKEWLDFTPNDNEQKICSYIETLGIVMNKLIKNQKYLKEKYDSYDREN